jgi:ribosome-binding protein aMBF1 (putative translation factor)
MIMAVKRKRAITDAVEILDRKYYKGKPERQVALEQERLNAKIAREIYTLRTKAGFTQAELARKVGTTASVISRLEDADYEGHSLSMLQRVASALERKVEIRLVPNRNKRHGTLRPDRGA